MGRSIYTIEDINSKLDFAPNAFVALDYSGAPTVFQLEQEIVADLHTNQFQEIGCHVCGNVDMFTRELNNKGRRYRCGYCLYNSESEFETVKSKKDITLSSFGLDYVCDICGEVMDSYNRGTIIKHLQKHEDANKVSEAEGEEQRKCCECQTTESLTTIQAGTYCYSCLPINLGAEEMFYYHGTDMTNLASILKEGIRPTADTDSRWGEDIMDISPYPYYYAEIDDILPSVFVADSVEEARWWADESGIEKIGVLKISSQVENLENFHGDGNGYKTSETIPKEYIVEVITPESFASETTDSEIRQWLKVLRDTDPDWEEIDWEKPSDKPDPDWEGIEWEAERRIVKGMEPMTNPLSPQAAGNSLTPTWSLGPQTGMPLGDKLGFPIILPKKPTVIPKQTVGEHQHQEAIAILNWMCKPADKPKEPMACPRCNSDEIDHDYDEWPDDEMENKNDIRRHYSCGDCSAVWVESWIYDSLLIVKRGTKS